VCVTHIYSLSMLDRVLLASERIILFMVTIILTASKMLRLRATSAKKGFADTVLLINFCCAAPVEIPRFETYSIFNQLEKKAHDSRHAIM
jgi:hypothetical protein